MEEERKALKVRLELQRLVYDFSSKMRAQRDVDSIGRILVEAVSELTSFRNAIISVFEEDGKTLRGVVGSGHKRTFEIGQRLAKYQFQRVRMDVSQIPQYVQAMESGEIYYHRTKEDIVNTLHSLTGLNPGILEIIRRTTRMNLALTVPLYIGSPGEDMVPLGFLGISSIKNRVAEEEVQVVRILADQASLAIYNALLFDRVKRQVSRARASEGRFRRIMDTAHDMIISYGTDGKVIFANNAIRESNLYSMTGELIDKQTLDRIHSQDQARLVEAYLGLQENIPIRGIEYRIQNTEGEWLTHNLNAAIVPDGNGDVSEVVAFIRDVTLERQREKQVIRRNKELEILNSLIMNLTSSTDYDEMITRSLSIIAEFTGADIISLISIGESSGESLMHLEGHLWVPDEYLEFLEKAFPKVPATGLFSGSEVQVLNDLNQLPPEFKHYMDKYGIKSILSVPVVRMGKPTGYVIAGLKEPYSVDDESIAILHAVGDQLGLVLETARLVRDTSG
ncbi:MAG: GAF domain-containing protein [Thermoplasmata archaeon]|nr:MAG: GAF domain-containing protein [Thermoplasmata archaeon]